MKNMVKISQFHDSINLNTGINEFISLQVQYIEMPKLPNNQILY